VSVATKVMTAEELLRLPDEGLLYELVRGELRTMSPAGFLHGRITKRIAVHLDNFVQAHRLGDTFASDTGFMLARHPDTVRAPDASFVQTERLVDVATYYPGAPDLAVEVVSPSDVYSEVLEKTREYLNAGTRAVVIVDPKYSTVVVHRATSIVKVTDTLEVDDVVPGWKMPLADIFD
jgi:Uma2 family endonuclease